MIKLLFLLYLVLHFCWIGFGAVNPLVLGKNKKAADRLRLLFFMRKGN